MILSPMQIEVETDYHLGIFHARLSSFQASGYLQLLPRSAASSHIKCYPKNLYEL